MLSAEALWCIGCSGTETLSERDHARFRAMARNRFYTFQLGMDHSRGEKKENIVKRANLVAGMVRELQENPGLIEAWQDSEFAGTPYGQLLIPEIPGLGPGSPSVH